MEDLRSIQQVGPEYKKFTSEIKKQVNPLTLILIFSFETLRMLVPSKPLMLVLSKALITPRYTR
jgi:hypothetical protein